MFEIVIPLVWVEERIDSIRSVDCSIGNALSGIRKKLSQTCFNTTKSILIFMTSTYEN